MITTGSFHAATNCAISAFPSTAKRELAFFPLRIFIDSFLGFWISGQKVHHLVYKKEVLCVLQSDLEVQLERTINEKKECEQNLER